MDRLARVAGGRTLGHGKDTAPYCRGQSADDAPRNEIARMSFTFMSSGATRRYIRAATSDDIMSASWKDILAWSVHQYRELTRLMNIMSTWPLSRS